MRRFLRRRDIWNALNAGGIYRRGEPNFALLLSFWIGMVLIFPVGPARGQAAAEGGDSIMRLSSPAFANTETIPDRFTCKGSDISPALAWEALPEGTKSLVLIFDDPDAPMGTWVHWVAYYIPAERKGLPEDVPKNRDEIAGGGLQGTNSWGRIGYGGPCPPSGTHRYYFRLYALDARLALKPGATKVQVTAAMKDHVLGEAELMGRYSRH